MDFLSEKKEILKVSLYTIHFFTIYDSKSTPLTLHLIIWPWCYIELVYENEYSVVLFLYSLALSGIFAALLENEEIYSKYVFVNILYWNFIQLFYTHLSFLIQFTPQ